MTKILSAEQIRGADQYTIEHEPIASIDLMERAATICFEEIINCFPHENDFHIYCGTGNNGGDGLVIARLLKEAGRNVHVSIIHFSPNATEDFNVNLGRLSTCGATVKHVRSEEQIPEPQGLVIDALLGSGVTRKAEGILAEVIAKINKSGVNVIAIDFPSGLFDSENTDENRSAAICSDLTLTFQVPKLAFLLPENEKNIGEWKVLDIGLDHAFIKDQSSKFSTSELSDIRKIIHDRSKFSHKGNHGHALLIGGSVGKIGAISMGAHSCLRSGVGLLSLYAPKCGYDILQTSVPEAMVIPCEDEEILVTSIHTNPFGTIGVGPGLGTHEETRTFLRKLINSFEKPMVIDADAINILSSEKTMLGHIPENSVLTPHPKEFDRLFGNCESTLERIKCGIENAQKYNIVIVLKGHHTAIITPNGEVFFNTSGNAGMATGGSGDVLTGILTGLLAQGYTPKESAILGVYLHGLAGDLAIKGQSVESMIATDLIEHLGAAFKYLHQE